MKRNCVYFAGAFSSYSQLYFDILQLILVK